MGFEKMLNIAPFLRKSLFFVPIFATNVFSGELTIEQRIEIAAKKSERNYINDKTIQKAVLKTRIRSEKENSKVGKEVMTKVRLLGVGNISSNMPLYKASSFAISYDIKTNYIPLTEFSLFENSTENRRSREVMAENVKMKLSMIDVGEKFKVISFLDNEDHGSDKYFILANASDKKYIIRAGEFERFFEIKPLAKDDSSRTQAFLNKIKPQTLEKNNGFNAIFCAEVQDYKKNPQEREKDVLRIRNLELDDPIFKELAKGTGEEVDKTFNLFKPSQAFTYDQPLTVLASDLDKKLCYGMRFKEKESFLTTFYFLPMYLKGNWRF